MNRHVTPAAARAAVLGGLLWLGGMGAVLSDSSDESGSKERGLVHQPVLPAPAQAAMERRAKAAASAQGIAQTIAADAGGQPDQYLAYSEKLAQTLASLSPAQRARVLVGE